MSTISSITIRQTPQQKRAADTVELILETAAVLLEEVGFERLSTNMICKRAGITPPALYRYFPNKYAILKVLGETLMQLQDTQWEEQIGLFTDFDNLEKHFANFMREQYFITQSQTSGRWILRSLHSVPLLCEVRLNSHDEVANNAAEFFLSISPSSDKETVRRNIRLMIEMGYAIIEYLFDYPDCDREAVIQDTARMMAVNFRTQLQPLIT